jgi:hypothetical protein
LLGRLKDGFRLGAAGQLRRMSDSYGRNLLFVVQRVVRPLHFGNLPVIHGRAG